MTKSEDKRIRATKDALETALLQLLQDKRLSSISVTELCKAAGINRNTFYCHYSYPAEVAKAFENRVFEKIKEELSRNDKTDHALITIIQFLAANKDISAVLSSANYDSTFFEDFFQYCYDCTLLKLTDEHTVLNLTKQKMAIHFLVSGSAAVVRVWLNNGAQEDPVEIAKMIDSLCKYGIRSIQ